MIRFAINKNGPIGLDIGSNSIKMLQFTRSGGNLRLAAADKMQCKFDMTEDPQKSKEFIVESIKEIKSIKSPQEDLAIIPSEALYRQFI